MMSGWGNWLGLCAVVAVVYAAPFLTFALVWLLS